MRFSVRVRPISTIAPEALWSGSKPVEAAERETIELRQLKHQTNGLAVPAVSRCAHGCPQALLQSPYETKFASGLVRLTCPHLVEQIDRWEAEGAVRELNSRLRATTGAEGTAWRAAMDSVNERHASTRRKLVSPEAEVKSRAALGAAFDVAMASGIAGITNGKNDDVKCLHAHVADELLSGENAIGAWILKELESARGCDAAGTAVCHEQCSGTGPWEYFPVKNKQKLWKTQSRRRDLKAKAKAKAFGAEAPLDSYSSDGTQDPALQDPNRNEPNVRAHEPRNPPDSANEGTL